MRRGARLYFRLAENGGHHMKNDWYRDCVLECDDLLFSYRHLARVLERLADEDGRGRIDLGEISEAASFEKKHIKPHMEALEERGLIEMHDDTYELVEP